MTVGAANARATLEAGFTTVRNVGSKVLRRRRPQAGHRARLHPGPRIVPATYAARLHRRPLRVDRSSRPRCNELGRPEIAKAPTSYRALVRKVHKYGAEVIKICATGGVLSKGDSVGRAADVASMRSRPSSTRRTGSASRWRRMRTAPRASTTRCAPASTPSSTRASPTTKSIHARQGARRLVRHGHLQRRLHPRRGPEERLFAGEHRQGEA